MRVGVAQTGVATQPATMRGPATGVLPADGGVFRQWMAQQWASLAQSSHAEPARAAWPGGSEKDENGAQPEARPSSGQVRTGRGPVTGEEILRPTASGTQAPATFPEETAETANRSDAGAQEATMAAQDAEPGPAGPVARVASGRYTGGEDKAAVPIAAESVPPASTLRATPGSAGPEEGAPVEGREPAQRVKASAKASANGSRTRECSGTEKLTGAVRKDRAAAQWPAPAQSTANPAAAVPASPGARAINSTARATRGTISAASLVPIAGAAQMASSAPGLCAPPDASGAAHAARPAEHKVPAAAGERTALSPAGKEVLQAGAGTGAAAADPVPSAGPAVASHVTAARAPAAAISAAVTHGSPELADAVFNRIDSGAAPQLLSRTPQRLDVGVRDAGLGWVEVRAHAAEGQIAATISTSPAAHPGVAAQLPAMRDYLASQQVRVDTLSAQTFEASADSGRKSPGQQNTGHNPAGAAGATAAHAGFSAEAEPESLSWIDVRV